MQPGTAQDAHAARLSMIIVAVIRRAANPADGTAACACYRGLASPCSVGASAKIPASAGGFHPTYGKLGPDWPRRWDRCRIRRDAERFARGPLKTAWSRQGTEKHCNPDHEGGGVADFRNGSLAYKKVGRAASERPATSGRQSPKRAS